MSLDVLAIGIYPINVAIHGGQRRVSALQRLMRHSAISSYYLPVHSSRYYPDGSDEEKTFGFSGDVHDIAFGNGERQDLEICRVFDVKPDLLDRLCAKIRELQPKCIQFEQPWLFPVLAAVRRRGVALTAKIIYSSQNVEHLLMASSHNRTATETLERGLVAASDLVIACTQSDAAVFASWGAANVVVGGNGHARRPTDRAGETDWLNALQKRDIMVYVGSGHPPNKVGFMEMLSPPGCVPPGCCIVVAGDVCQLIQSEPAYRFNHLLFNETTALIGRQSEQALDSIFGLAKAILLPVTSGGGSNLKTAEALLSGKPVIGTEKSFHGFEKFRTMSGVYVTDDPVRFKKYVRDGFAGRLVSRRTPEDVEELLWPNALRLVPAATRAVLGLSSG
jgi:hypothetical protein